MDIPSLKLIKAIDPTKVKVTINEKFSKLSLSSNKKKQMEGLDDKTLNEFEFKQRRRASRSLYEEFSSENRMEDKTNKPINAILKSSSSPCSINNNKQMDSLTEVCDLNISKDLEVSINTMEKLEVSEDQIEKINTDLNVLTQKVSSLVVCSLDEKKKIKNENIDTPIALNQFDLNAIPDSVDIISLDDTESIISVSSDTSSENDFKDANGGDYSIMVTSDIMQSGETGEPQIPCTLSNERANRVEAFLNDVSQEQKNLLANGLYQTKIILSDNHLNLTNMDKVDKQENVEENTKAKKIAAAETESISPIDCEFKSTKETLSIKTIKKDNPKRLIFDDTKTMTDFGLTDIQIDSHQSANENVENTNINFSVRKLANDETEANTTTNSIFNNDSILQEINESLESTKNDFDNSLTIPETSSENIDSSCDRINLSTEKNQELLPSNEAISTNSSKTEQKEHSSFGISLGSINISAKINIKLQIQTEINYSSEEQSEENVSEIEGLNTIQENINENSESKSEGSDSVTYNANIVAEKENPNTRTDSAEYDTPKTPIQNKKENLQNNAGTEGNHFENYAEKILNELYGNTWKTPDVIRTLKKTIRSTKVNAEDGVSKMSNINKDNSDHSKSTKKTLMYPEVNKSVEDILLDDFSTFRINIAKTNLDSTRLATPQPKKTKSFTRLGFGTDPKQRRSHEKNLVSKVPKTEIKSRNKSKTPARRFRRLVIHDRDDDVNSNISDDTNINKTVVTDEEEDFSNASDSSWRNSLSGNSESDDSDRNDNKRKNQKGRQKSKIRTADRLIYMDLSKEEITILRDTPTNSPPANKDENFRKHLSELLDSFHYKDRPKINPTPTSTGKLKRRLFNGNFGTVLHFGDDEENKTDDLNESPKAHIEENVSDKVRFNGEAIPSSFNIYNKHLEAVKTGRPVFPITPNSLKLPKTQNISRGKDSAYEKKTPANITPLTKNKKQLQDLCSTPNFKYSFLKSLDVCVGKSMCHPDALVFRENYRQKKEDLTSILYELYNSKVFKNDLDVSIVWNKKLLNTAGRCLNKKKLGKRLSVVELSEKVLTSADRLRCTLIHELCHAATWVFNGEGGHGATWKEWARKANSVFPELPKIGVCHQYEIEYKYTYKCTLCEAKSYYHSKSKKVENIRCSYCHGAIEVFLNKKDKDGNVMHTPVREPTGFAKFVKENYQQYKKNDMKHADVMKILSNEFAALKVAVK